MKKRVYFGFGQRSGLSGAELAVRILQGASLPPALFILAASAYTPVMQRQGVLAVLCELGLSVLPRWLLLLLSLLYRASGSEVLAAVAPPAAALVFGLIAGPLLGGRQARAVIARRVFAALLGLELLSRLIPLRFNLTFGWVFAAFGFLAVLGCLVLVLLDLRAAKKKEKE